MSVYAYHILPCWKLSMVGDVMHLLIKSVLIRMFYAANAFLSVYAKYGWTKLAVQVLEEISEHN